MKITPEFFDDPRGGFVVCESEEEYRKCLEELHYMGYIWQDGEDLYPINEETLPAYSVPEKKRTRMPSFLEAVYDSLHERDDEVVDTRYMMVGTCPTADSIKDGIITAFKTVGFVRISEDEWANKCTVNYYLWRARRVKFKNVEWPARGTYPEAPIINYEDENYED